MSKPFMIENENDVVKLMCEMGNEQLMDHGLTVIEFAGTFISDFAKAVEKGYQYRIQLARAEGKCDALKELYKEEKEKNERE